MSAEVKSVTKLFLTESQVTSFCVPSARREMNRFGSSVEKTAATEAARRRPSQKAMCRTGAGGAAGAGRINPGSDEIEERG
jgi:hypothetical protein